MNDTDTHRKKVVEAFDFLAAAMKERPEILLILGTGLGGLAGRIDTDAVFPYETIPNFPCSTAAGHAGNLLCGRLHGHTLAVMQGRFHYYEGYSAREITFPVRVFALLGAKYLIVSNAAGGLNPAFFPGTIMVIRDHLNFTGANPLRGPNIDEWGPRFPDLSEPYDPILIQKTLDCAGGLGLAGVRTGVYVAVPGPSLETPAETRFLRNCGADAVGMSTVPEVIAARHAGLRVLGLSVVANVNDPDNQRPVIVEDVISQSEKTGEELERLVMEVIKEL